MHLNPYGEYAVLLAGSLANDWPSSRAGIVARTREFGMTMTFGSGPHDHGQTRAVIDDWLRVVDATDPDERAALLNAEMAATAAYPRLTDHDGEGWHLHYRDDGQSLARVLRAVIAVGTSLHLVTRGWTGSDAAHPTRARTSSSMSRATAVSASARCAAPTARPCAVTASARQPGPGPIGTATPGDRPPRGDRRPPVQQHTKRRSSTAARHRRTALADRTIAT